MLLSARDNVRTDTAIEEDGLKAEVAAGREGQECYSEPHTLTTAQEADGPLQCAVCAGIKHNFSAVKAISVITENCNCN